MIKVLFLQNLEHQQVGEIKSVPDGYARNYLFPKKLAVLATDEEVKALEGKLAKIKSEEEKNTTKAQEIADQIEKAKFVFSAQAGDEDKLFGAVTNRDLAELLNEKKIEIDKHNIEILEPIHTLGEHQALIKIGHGVHATMTVEIIRAK